MSTKTETAGPEPRCRIHRDVTFAPCTRYELTLRAGSVVAWSPSLNGPCAIRVHFAGRVAVIDMDDASPVEWDDAEQQWVEA